MYKFNHFRNFGCRLIEVIYKGYKTLFVENQKIRIGVLVDKGCDIFEFLNKPLDIDFLWRSYQGIRQKNFFSSIFSKEGNFLDLYYGGWQELFPNAGDSVNYKGAELPQHGEIHSIPWQYEILKDEPEEVKVKFYIRTYRTCFYIEKIISIHDSTPAIFLNETIINESNEEMNFMWGHHPAFGPPFLSEDCYLDLPKSEILTDEVNLSPATGRLKIAHYSKWPITLDRNKKAIDLSKIPSAQTHSHDRAYIYGYEKGWFAITNKKTNVGFGLSFDPKIFKYLWFWQVYGGAFGYPWYGTNYNIAIEPNSSYPPNLLKAIDNNTALSLRPKEFIRTSLTAVAFESKGRVKEILADGKVIF